MKRYSSYKDSGVEWIGEIPKGWSVKKLKNFGEVTLGKMLTNEDKGGYFLKPYLRSVNIQTERVDVSDVKEMWFSERELEKYRLSKGDLLFNEGGDVGRTCLWNGELDECYIQNSVNRVRVNSSEKYILYHSILHHQTWYYNSVVDRVSIPHLTKEKLELIPFVIPPLSEQQQIVSYLDEQTSSIDTLIQSKQKKITLLKEKRTSLINQIVTKGLNPNVEMKDSGVEWIGEIPSGWISTKFNRYVFFQEGPGLRTYQFTESGTKVICVTNITENGIDFTYEKFISTEEYVENYQHFTVEKGDLLLSSSGNSWGKVSEYMDDEKVMLNTSTIRLNTLSEDLFTKSLIKHLLKSDLVRKQLEILMTGSCQPNFGPSHLNQLIIPIPPLTEQMEIVEYLDRETELIDKTVSIEERKIELLKEYKQSLISEVITGKRKVVSDD